MLKKIRALKCSKKDQRGKPATLHSMGEGISNLSCTAYVFAQQHKYKLGFLAAGFLCLTVVAFPDVASAASLEQQLDSANSLVTNKLKKYGILGASIASGIWSIFKGNVKQAAVIVAIGIILSYHLGWVEGGMQLTTTT